MTAARRIIAGCSVPGLALCAVVGALAGSGGYTVYYAEGLSYLSDDPRACINCHIMRDQFADWQRGSHHAHATCNDCHIPHDNAVHKYLVKAENGFWHSKGFTLQDFHEPIRIRPGNARVLDANCAHCHQELVSQIRQAADPHRSGWNCTHCHVAVGHGPTR